MRLSLITASLLLLLPTIAAAQALGGSAETVTGDPFSVAANPQYPAPYSTATLSFLPGTVDLTNATLSVSANGKTIYQGSAQPVSVPLGKAGSVMNITLTVSSAGSKYTKSLSLQPQDVALIAEPVASVPPLYLGKPLVPVEGDVRVVAIANLKSAAGVSPNPATLSYVWSVDGTTIANSSGIGKTALMVASPLQYRARAVEVAVMSQDGSLVGGSSLSLSSQDPSVRIYENNPLLGIRFDHALSGTYAITTSESTLYAAPFSFPTTSGTPLVQWFLNGSVAQTGNSITLRPAGTGQGSASLSLIASFGDSRATTDLSVVFGAKTGSNFFGL